MKIKAGLCVIGAAVLISGCTSMTVSSDTLTRRTSHALGLSEEQFSISSRSDSVLRSDFNVTTGAGKLYSCYVTSIGIVSDALCTEMRESDSGEPISTGVTNCNALLKAAGRCN